LSVQDWSPWLNLGFLQIDGIWSTVGSTNLDRDYRSFALNEELNVVLYDTAIAGRLEAVFDHDLAHSRQVTYEDWAADLATAIPPATCCSTDVICPTENRPFFTARPPGPRAGLCRETHERHGCALVVEPRSNRRHRGHRLD
jgi:hypothetical protein